MMRQSTTTSGPRGRRARRREHAGRKGVGLTSVIALVAGMVTATAAVTVAAAGPAAAATSPSQQWASSVGSLTGTPQSRTITFGSTGVTATQVAGTSSGGDCGMIDPTGGGAVANYPQFLEPDPPDSARIAAMRCQGQSDGTTTLTFSKPVYGPILHVINLDASQLNVTGESTAGEPLGLTPLAGNNALEIVGNQLNKTRQDAINGGCMLNDGSNPNGGCGSVQLAADSGAIQTVSLYNVTKGSGLTGGFAFDGWNFTLSFPTAPLTKQFDPATITAGGTSTLTFTITNPDDSGSIDLPAVDFTDDLPAGLTIADSTVTIGDQCGSPSVTDKDGAALAAGSTSVTATGAGVAVGASCTIAVKVTAQQTGSYVNNNSNLSTSVANLVANADTTLTVTSDPQPWSCDPYGYLFQTDGAQDSPHTVTAIDLATGESTDVGETDDYVNAVGFNPKDNYFYAWDVTRSEIVKINSDLSLTHLGVPPGLQVATYITGDFDKQGHFWITTNAAPNYYWAEIDYGPGAKHGVTIAGGSITSGAENIPSDWSFIDGTLYGLRRPSGGDQVHLFAFDPTNSAIVDKGVLDGPNDWVGAGATYTDGTYLYGSDNPTGNIYRVDPATRQTILVANGPKSSGNDGARCASEPIPTITVTKTVANRVSPDDQFTVALKKSSDVLTSTTTQGSTTGDESTVSSTNWPVSPDTTYTITDATTTGSPNTIDAYTPSVSCTAGDATVTATPVDGETGQWTVGSSTFDAITCDVTNTPKVSGTPFQCPANAPGMLFQHIAPATPPTKMNTIDIVTGQPSTDPVFTIDGRAINAVGYNTEDNYVYGWDRDDNKGVVRIASDGSVQELGVPAGFGAYQAPIIGDVDDQGHYWIISQLSGGGQDKHWFEIDLNPGDGFMTILNQGDITWTAAADWAFLPTTNALYTVGTSGDDVRLYRFDRDTHTLADLGSLGAGGAGITNPGAMYADPNGHLYTSNNTGGAIYRVDVTAGPPSAALFAQGPPSSGNDGARCATSQIAIDFGDAPDSYGTTLAANGPRHLIPGYDEGNHTAPLMLGAHIDAESDGQPGPNADGDDTNGVDDEDGVADPIVIESGVATSVTVSATNSTATAAVLAGWIDFNGNGTFDTGELATVGVPPNSGAADYTVTWSARTATSTDTYARFRLFGGNVDSPSPTGSWPSGEVEDYPVHARSLTVTKSSDATAATRVGDTVHYTITVKNTGSAGFTAEDPAQMVDDLTGVLDDGTVKDGSLTVTGSEIQADVSQADKQVRWSGPLGSGDTVTIEYDVVLNKAGDQDVRNVAFQPPPCASDDCPLPTPPARCTDGVDPDTGLACDSTEFLLPTLTVTKSSDDLVTAQIGSTVHYSITATNTGKAPFTADGPATMVDDLSALLDYASYGGDAAIADGGPGAVSYTDPQITWTGPLGVGNSVTVTYTVTVTRAGTLKNTVFEWPTCESDGAAECPPPAPPAQCTDGVDPTTGLSCDSISGGIPALEITKSAPGLATARIGDTITWTVTATNVGTRDFTADAPAAIVDDLSDVLDDSAPFDGIVTVDGSDIDASYVDSPHPQIGWAGPLGHGDTVTLTYSTVLTGAGNGTVANIVWQVPPGPEAPCDLGDCPAPPIPDCQANDGTTPDTGLPCVPVMQLLPRPELAKTSSPANPHLGDTVTYTVTFTNEGPGDYTADRPAQVADDLSGVLGAATFDGTVTVTGSGIAASYDPNVTPQQIVWSGPLASGDTVTLTYQVVLTGKDGLTATNVAYVPPPPPACPTDAHGDCPPPPVPAPPDPKNCTDGVDSATGLPCVPVTLELPQLEITKTSPDLAGAHIGDEVTYTITAKSVGARDFSADDPALVIDDLAGVLDDATFDGTVAVDGSTIEASYDKPRVTWTGPLAVGDTVTLTYTVRLTGAGDLSVTNVAFVPPSPPACGADGNCPPYDPPTPPCASAGSVDRAIGLPCLVVHRDLPKLELHKSSPNLATASIGDDVTFVVTATNVGKRAFTAGDPALVIDDLTGVLDDATFDGTVTVAGSKVTASYDKPRVTWTGPLAVGDTVTLTYRVHLTGDGDLRVTNVAFVPPSPPACDTSGTGNTGGAADCPPYDPPTPPAPDCAAHGDVDPATGLPCVPVSQDLRKLQVTKSSDAAGIVRNGDTVTYSVTAKNVGPGDYTAGAPATVVDDLTGVLDDATYAGDATADRAGDLAYAKAQISWIGALPAGKAVTITYSVVVTGQGDLDMLNVAFAPLPLDADCAGSGSCPPPDPGDCSNGTDRVTGQPCAATEMPLPGLYVTKKASNDVVSGGDTVSFTVTMTNTGNVAFTADDPAVLTDNLASVLDDAAYRGDAKADVDGDLRFADRTLTWSGALAVGRTVTVTYSVTVNSQATGDDRLNNVASIPDGISPHYPGGVCPEGAPTCDPPSPQAVTVGAVNRSVVIPPSGGGQLPDTGTDTWGQLQIAALLLLFGIGMAVLGRRRRMHRTA